MSSATSPFFSPPAEYILETLAQLPTGIPLYGVIGHPIAHSLSPAFQNAGFAANGLPAQYVRIHVLPGQLPEAVQRMKEVGFHGWNCTLPYKVEMFDLIDREGGRLHQDAENAQAVNTVLVDRSTGKLQGYSTDGWGWDRAVLEEFALPIKEPHALRILILGLGGAGTSLAIHAGNSHFREIVLANRTDEKTQTLVKRLEQRFPETMISGIPLTGIQGVLPRIDLLVNCISVGAGESIAGFLSPEAHYPHLKVHDTNYNPLETPLMKAARVVGAQTANGLSMLLHQGARAFEIWTGQTAPLNVMRSALQTATAASG